MFFAYLDAGSGSLLLQAVLGGIAGVVVAARAWKARVMGNQALGASEPSEGSDDESALTES